MNCNRSQVFTLKLIALCVTVGHVTYQVVDMLSLYHTHPAWCIHVCHSSFNVSPLFSPPGDTSGVSETSLGAFHYYQQTGIRTHKGPRVWRES